MRVREAAEKLGLTGHAVRAMIRDGRLQAVRKQANGYVYWEIREDALAEFVATHRLAGDKVRRWIRG